jgi:SAM-dependent methyltransferase
MSSVTPQFLEALQRRRSLQAKQIITKLKDDLTGVRVLDYGCGQGSFVRFLLQHGVDAYGCDISELNVDSSALGARFTRLAEPWSMPSNSSYTVISMLDVLEHAKAPAEVLRRLSETAVKTIIVKVPMLHGPIGLSAQVLAEFRRTGLLERLLLVGENSPHYSFFTSRGLIKLFQAHSFSLKKAFRIADVGQELPERLRREDWDRFPAIKHSIGTFVGVGLALLAPIWSDTKVFSFSRET